MKLIRGLNAMFLILTLSSLPFVAAGEGGGSVVGGGGGAFVKRSEIERLIFWDLSMVDPQFEDEPGEKYIMSAAGKAAHGEWVPLRKLKAHEILTKRLKLLGPAIGHLIARLKSVNAEEIPLIFTDLPISRVTELGIPSDWEENAYGAQAYPGAYFDARTRRVFVNVDIWNRAGLLSQAAMLLHEEIRVLQPYLLVSNENLQEIVARVFLGHADNVLDLLFLGLIDRRYAEDLLYEQILPLPVSPASSAGGAVPAASEVRQGVVDGFLGRVGEPVPVDTLGRGKLGESRKLSEVRTLRDERIWIEPTRCLSGLRSRQARQGSALTCDQRGLVRGSGALEFSFPEPLEKSLMVDAAFYVEPGPLKFAFEMDLIDSDTREHRRLPITFETDGDFVRVRYATAEPVEIPRGSFVRSSGVTVVRIRLGVEKDRVDVVLNPNTNPVTVASWPLALSREFFKGGWGFQMSSGVVLHHVAEDSYGGRGLRN